MSSADDKHHELEAIARETLSRSISNSDEVAATVISEFCDITPPQHLISMILATTSGGTSYKPGNIVLNWKRLIEVIPNVVLTASGVTTSSPVLVILAALHVWNSVRSLVTVDVDEHHATALYVMWQNADYQQRISEDKAYEMTNEYLASQNKGELSINEFAKIIDDLCRVKCIELTDAVIWLREWARIKYD